MPSFEKSQSSFDVKNIQDYFAKLNPIAELIANDISNTKANYGQLWHTLSINEQNDIINESLIQPEISLRYFDSFSVSPETNSSSSTSKSASDDSLTAVVLKNISHRSKENKNESDNKCHHHLSKKHKTSAHTNIKDYYLFDGRNLHTFAMQKAALKFIHDDVLGTYRDEHSMPFSYKTQSQINLNEFSKHLNNDENARSLALKHTENISVVKHDRAFIENFVSLQKELRLNLQKEQNKNKLTQSRENRKPLINNATNPTVLLPASKVKMPPSRPQVKPPPAPIQVPDKKSVIVDCKKLENLVSADKQNDNKAIAKTASTGGGHSAQTMQAPVSSSVYATYSDLYYDHYENANLMLNHNLDTGHLTTSSSSAVTSDDDDEKTICEEVKLLNNDANLRKGFDFLNNW